MKARGGRTEEQLLGMVKSGGDGAIHLHHHGDVTEVHPQGKTNLMFPFGTELMRILFVLQQRFSLTYARVSLLSLGDI